MILQDGANSILLAVLAAALAVFLVMTMVFKHHWRNYGYDEAVMARAGRLYIWGSVLFLGLAAAALTYLYMK